MLAGKASNGRQHGAVYGTCIVQQGTKNFLDTFGVARAEWWRMVRGSGELDGSTIDGAFSVVW